MKQFSTSTLKEVAAKVGKVTHLEALKGIPEILKPYTDNSISKKDGSETDNFKIAVFNLERGEHLEETISFFKQHRILSNVNIIFANELDWGMARTDNLNTTGELAKAIGMNYAFGTEFVTMSAGQDGNKQGLHGNAILSDYPLTRVSIVHLPPQFEWLHREGDPRLGLRNAIFAQTQIDGKEIGLVCTHLENRSTPKEREKQIEFLLDEIDSYFGDIPVIIGGDMNTNTVDGNKPEEMDDLNADAPEQWRRLGDIPAFEPQLKCVVDRGYTYEDCNIMEKVTRRKPMPEGRTILLNLDWFYQRGLKCTNPVRVESIFRTSSLEGETKSVEQYNGQELSDHDIVLVDCKI